MEITARVSLPSMYAILSKPRNRWRVAFSAIYSCRVLHSLAKEIVENRTAQLPSRISRSLSYTILHIRQNSSDNDVHDTTVFSSIDQRSLTEIVDKDLPQVGGVEDVAHALDTNAEDEIHDNDETILHIKQNSSDNDVHDYSNLGQRSLTEIVKKKDMGHLRRVGGVGGVARALETDAENGILDSTDEGVSHRRNTYGSNTFNMPPAKGFLFFVLKAFKDITVLALMVCAAISLGFRMKNEGLKKGWYEGGSIFVSVFLVVSVSAVSNFRQSRQFDKLSKIGNSIQVYVIRDGQQQQVSIFDIVVGDIVCLKIGDQIPADGLFLDGHSLQVDESSMTGESNPVEVDCSSYPFLFSGTKVVNGGYTRMLVTSVGMNTWWGKRMSSISCDTNERTPLQIRLDKLTSTAGNVGLAVNFLFLLVFSVCYFTGNTKNGNKNRVMNGSQADIDDVLKATVRFLADAVTFVVAAIPEGLPLAILLARIYLMKRMMADQVMVRKLSACETMGSATTVCTDKTGTLTLNQMKVTMFWLGQDKMTGRASTNIAQNVLQLLRQGEALNTTGSVCIPQLKSKPEFYGSPTEKSILSWAVLELGMGIEKVKLSCTILHVEAFNSEKKRSGVLIRKKVDNTIHVHWKGAAEIILAMCSNYYDCFGITKAMDEGERMKNEQIIEDMAANSLRCIAFAHKKIPDGELEYSTEDGKTHQLLKEDGLTLLGLVGLQDPCRPEVTETVKTFKNAGVNIKMITGDHVSTARAIAIECGILNPNQGMGGGEVMEGVEFRSYTEEERMEKVDRIGVMARSSTIDKLLMVQCLKRKGHVVAVIGDGTNDAPALKEADVGLSMGIQGTEVAKESSDIVILDDNFASVATVLKWGRCAYNNIQKFIQFQLTVNVTSLVINFVAAVSATHEVPLTTIQLLWVSLIVDTLAALALATDLPTKELMKKPPVGHTEPLITNVMWRNLITQALYQITIVLVLQFKGKSIFNVDQKVKDILIFNTYILCQIFNKFNARELEKKNVFKGIHKNHLFLEIVGITIVFQVVMVEFLHRFANTVRLSWEQWIACIVIAAVSWPISWVFKSIPNSR